MLLSVKLLLITHLLSGALFRTFAPLPSLCHCYVCCGIMRLGHSKVQCAWLHASPHLVQMAVDLCTRPMDGL